MIIDCVTIMPMLMLNYYNNSNINVSLLLSSVTNLSSDDWRIDDELNELVEQLVQEPDAGVQQSPSQSRHAGLQLPLHVGLCDDDVLQAEGEGVLLQDVDQGEELVQVWVLQSKTVDKQTSLN